MTSPTLISGGRVLDPASGTDRVGNILIRGGTIESLDAPASVDGATVIDATGLLVTPGLIDPHVHLREPGQEHKETIETGSRAAVAGGFTTVCCMPNTSPTLDTPEQIDLVFSRAEESALCRVFPVAAATKGRQGDELAEIGLMLEAGAVGTSDDGDVIASAGMMQRVLLATRESGAAFMQHAQEPTLTQGASMHAGSVSMRLGLTGWPRVAEELIVERDIRLTASLAGGPCRYHVQHISSGNTIELLRRAQEAGLPVSGEASPHHLLLTHEAVAGASGQDYDTAAKMNPPLREQSDIDALRQGVADGVISVLATDHAPHAPDEKAASFEAAPFGIIGLETALALYAEALVHNGLISWMDLIRLMTVGPAELCNLSRQGLGRLAEGGPADVTLIDPEASWTIDEACFRGKSRNSPFIGRKASGRAVRTIVAGETVFDLAELATEAR